MDAIPIPSVLTRLAQAGRSGMIFDSDPLLESELDVCRAWGFRLAVSGDRIRLEFDCDQLVPPWIESETPAISWHKVVAHGYLRIGSTNVRAIEEARRGAPCGTLIYSEEQSAGRGRKGRKWHSPAGRGLYFSLVLRPKQPVKNWPLLTHTAALGLVNTFKKLSDTKLTTRPLVVDLKWPNDVLLSGRKSAGILLETVSGAAVVGIGINVRKGGVPEFMQNQAVCLDEMAGTIVPRRRLLVVFLREFQLLYRSFERGELRQLLELWKSHSSMWNGVTVCITEGESRKWAVTCGISEEGALLVRTPEGIEETVLAGDISVCTS